MLKENYNYITQQNQLREDIIQTPNYSKIKYNQNLLTNYTQKQIQNRNYIQSYKDNFNNYNKISPDFRFQRKIAFSQNNNNNSFILQKIIPMNLIKNNEEIRKIEYSDISYQFPNSTQNKMISENKFLKKIKILYPQNCNNNRSYININNNMINSPIYNNYYNNINISPQKSNTYINHQYDKIPIKKRIIISKLNPTNNDNINRFNYNNIDDSLNNDNNKKMISNITENNSMNNSPKKLKTNFSENKLNIIKLNNDESKIITKFYSNDNINKNIFVRKLPSNNFKEDEFKRITNKQILQRKPSQMKIKKKITAPNNREVFKEKNNNHEINKNDNDNKRNTNIKNLEANYQNKIGLVNLIPKPIYKRIPTNQPKNYNCKGGYEMMIKDFVYKLNTEKIENNIINEKNGIVIDKEKIFNIARRSKSKKKTKNVSYILNETPSIINNNFNNEDVNYNCDLKFRIDYLGKSQCGKINGVFKTNQDHYKVNENLNNIKNFNIFILCDGHGVNGHLVSNFVSQYIIIQISNHPSIYPLNDLTQIYYKLKENNYQIIKNIFLDTDNKISKQQFDTSKSGTTCVFVIQLGNKLICGNVGDSRTILIYDSNKNDRLKYTKIFQMSIDAKPNLSKEKERIIKNGGEVRIGKNNKGKNIGPFRVYAKGMDQPGLAMSRSLGDFLCKKIGVSNEPTFKEYIIDESCKYLVLGSDGVWDYLDNEEIMKIGNKHYLSNNLEGFCQEVIGNATYRWENEDSVIDDITLIAVFFKFY